MKPFPLLLATALAVSGLALAQTPIEAPAGWKTQSRAKGATSYTPPDLRVGEIYSITLYDAAPLGGKSLDAYLRGFAGPVGAQTGQLQSPLQIGLSETQSVAATGIYAGPKGAQLFALFNAVSLDGGRHVHIARALSSRDALFERYKNPYIALVRAMVTRARNGGAPARPKSSGAQEAPQPAPKLEENPYPFVTAPGRGVKAAQIEAILHRYDADFDNNRYINEAYLLLRDGTAHNGLPVPPEMLDLSKSRAKEPKAWGKWRRVAGGYQVAWAGQAFDPEVRTATVPGTPRVRLEGHFATGQSDMFSHHFWGVTFDKAGRFSKSERGAVTTGNFGGLAPQVTTTFGDGGTGTTIAGGNSGASGAAFKKQNPNADREGTYTLDGYTLTLRYDSGRVVRQLFFFRDATRKELWFEGDTLQLGFGD